MVTRLAAMSLPDGVTVPVGSVIRRTHAGYWQKAAGAWTWHLEGPDGYVLPVGSQFPVTTLLRCRHEWTAYQPRDGVDVSIDPCLACFMGTSTPQEATSP